MALNTIIITLIDSIYGLCVVNAIFLSFQSYCDNQFYLKYRAYRSLQNNVIRKYSRFFNLNQHDNRKRFPESDMNISFGTDHLTCFFQVNKRISFEGSFILWFILFNATFNNISVISWQSAVLLVEENRSTRRK